METGRHLETRRRGADGRHLDGRWGRGGQPGLGPAGTVRGSRIDGGVWGGARVGLDGTLLRRRCGTLGGHHEPVAGHPGATLGGQPGRGAHRRGASRRRFETGVVDAVDVVRVVRAVDVVAVGAGRGLGVA
ncbi:hypothetical protein [Micromonospora noduli]|uniref:hypothetical protein n=1 Tax=Micromonospora noduli TaxID=709876 RepID=UPI0011BF0228|nr:hypothetical protein [Micromonospora noduli]